MVSELKPFKPEHADQIIALGLNDKLMEIDAGYQDNRICDYSQKGNAYTMFINGKPVFACGIVVLWQGVAECWVMASQNIYDIKFLAVKTILDLQDKLCKKNKIRRLQTSVKADFKKGLRLATWCGLEIEGLKKKYGPDGSDYYQLGKIY
tara:strand:- start:297 stop:746 length:450 start_codon:yes stop_codon:yes gene_type:complete